LASLLASLATPFSPAGPLDPPAAPASTSGTEPRLAVNQANTPGAGSFQFVISAPGSYYLTENLVGESGMGGITITASDVTLDLNGFTVAGVPGASHGIYAFFFEVHGVTVRNGTVTGWGSEGVDLTSALSSRVENVTSRANGFRGFQLGDGALALNCISEQNSAEGFFFAQGARVIDCVSRLNDGIGFFIGAGSAVSGCVAQLNGGRGFVVRNGSTVTECVADHNGGIGVEAAAVCTVSRCSARGNSGIGISVDFSSTVAECAVTANGGGISADYDCVIRDCVSSGNSLFGIQVTSDCQILNNLCRGNSTPPFNLAAGISISGFGSRVEGNTLIVNDRGIRATAADNLIIRNTARLNSEGDYETAPGNDVGEIISTPGTGFVATNPWANFVH
jgi:hypothetical protein